VKKNFGIDNEKPPRKKERKKERKFFFIAAYHIVIARSEATWQSLKSQVFILGLVISMKGISDPDPEYSGQGDNIIIKTRGMLPLVLSFYMLHYQIIATPEAVPFSVSS
jgi:hypothetical protein